MLTLYCLTRSVYLILYEISMKIHTIKFHFITLEPNWFFTEICNIYIRKNSKLGDIYREYVMIIKFLIDVGSRVGRGGWLWWGH